MVQILFVQPLFMTAATLCLHASISIPLSFANLDSENGSKAEI